MNTSRTAIPPPAAPAPDHSLPLHSTQARFLRKRQDFKMQYKARWTTRSSLRQNRHQLRDWTPVTTSTTEVEPHRQGSKHCRMFLTRWGSAFRLLLFPSELGTPPSQRSALSLLHISETSTLTSSFQRRAALTNASRGILSEVATTFTKQRSCPHTSCSCYSIQQRSHHDKWMSASREHLLLASTKRSFRLTDGAKSLPRTSRRWGGTLQTLAPHPALPAPPRSAFRRPARASPAPPIRSICPQARARGPSQRLPLVLLRAPHLMQALPGACAASSPSSPPPAFPDSLARARSRRWRRAGLGPVRERGAIRVSFGRPRASGRDASPPGAHRRRQPRGQLLFSGQRRGRPLHGEVGGVGRAFCRLAGGAGGD